MNSNNSIMSIRFLHPSENVMDLCKLIGFTTISGWSKGDLRASPRGTPVPSWGRDLFYAVVSTDFSEPSSINLKRVCITLTAADTEMEIFHRTGGKIALYITVTSGTDLVFDLKTLSQLSDLKISVQIDTYSDKSKPIVVADGEEFIEMIPIDPIMSVRLSYRVEIVMDMCRHIGFISSHVGSGGDVISSDGVEIPSKENRNSPCVLVSVDESADILDNLENFLNGAESIRQKLETFQESGSELSIVITMASGTGLSDLDWETLRRLSSLNIVLRIATYVDDRKTPRLS